MVKLSVVIPHLNYGRYLRECLDSLDVQTFRDFEAILVDGGSTDCTFDVLRDYPWVKVLSDVPAQGPVKAVNKGILQARGRYFHQLNSDCILEPTMFEECMDVLEPHPELGFVYTSWKIIDDEGNIVGSARQPKRFNRNLLLHGNFVDASSMVMWKGCMAYLGLFDERCPWSMDWLMAAKVSQYYAVRFLDRPLFRYRVHKGQITESKSQKEAGKALKILRGYYSKSELFKSDCNLLARKLGRKLIR